MGVTGRAITVMMLSISNEDTTDRAKEGGTTVVKVALQLGSHISRADDQYQELDCLASPRRG